MSTFFVDVGRMSSVHVSVRSLPRREEIPRIMCPHASFSIDGASSPSPQGPQGQSVPPLQSSEASSSSATTAESSTAPSPIPVSSEDDNTKLSIAAALEPESSPDNLRKALVKSRLAECQQLPRSESMDSMLGDSLLDPPQSLQKIPPKRYQSPSRCGSPSLEAPDHLLFGTTSKADAASHASAVDNSSRLARQDLLRRRDINLYSGLHPRLLHGQQPSQVSPRLSLFSHHQNKLQNSNSAAAAQNFQPRNAPCRAFPAASMSPQMPSPSLFNAKSQDEHRSSFNERSLGAKLKVPPKLEHVQDQDDDEDSEAEDGILPPELSFEELNWSRRSSLKDDAAALPKCKKTSTLDDILGIQPESGFFSPSEDRSVTRVYRAEIPPVNNPASTATAATSSPSSSEVSKSDLLLGAILRTCERNRHLETEDNGIRLRSLSENSQQYYNSKLIEPLDLGFENNPKDWSEEDDEEEDEEEIRIPPPEDTSRRSSFSSDAHVPTPDECASFRQSFDSATSMVFHRRTGLPLTSSPAPLRRGTDKFDFDDSITSPHDIKKALFAKKASEAKKALALSLQQAEENNNNYASEDKENLNNGIAKLDLRAQEAKTSPKSSLIHHGIASISKRERRPSKKLLSASAPATLTSNNLLGNFEESVLNGRLEPNSTVEGFTAEIGASGSFQPKHKTLPVTVFFYTLCDNAAYSSPYLGKSLQLSL